MKKTRSTLSMWFISIIGVCISVIGWTVLLRLEWWSHVQAFTPTVIPSSTIDTAFPSRATPNPEQNITNLTFRLATLPYDQDKTAAWYVVYPKVWVTIPLVWPNASDLEKIKFGNEFNHYTYLEQGALHYVGNAPDQGVGNMVLAAHSSFAKQDTGRYKTVGQVAPLSSLWDKVFVYLADDRGEYTLYVYTIRRSEEIAETNVSILDQTVTEKTLTLFTCYPIGTTDARRVNQAVLTDTLPEEKRTWVIQAVDQSWANSHASAPVIKSTSPVFSTQPASKVLKTEKKEKTMKNTTTTGATHSSAPVSWDSFVLPALSGSGDHTTKSTITPTFKERVIFRPVVYRTAIRLITTVGFKRSNLAKLTTLLDQKIAWYEATLEKNPEAKKKIVLFLLIKEIIEGFMK